MSVFGLVKGGVPLALFASALFKVAVGWLHTSEDKCQRAMSARAFSSTARGNVCPHTQTGS